MNMLALMRLTASALAFLALLVLPRPLHAASWDEIVAAAKKEGVVTVYTTTLGAVFHKILAARFKDKYGIEVNFLDLRGSEVRERIRIEQVAKHRNGDVVQLSPVSLEEVNTEGNLQPLPDVPNQTNLLPQFARTDFSIPSQVYGFGMLINTRLVKADEEPKSWQDLLDPKWRGKILSDDFRAAGGGEVFFEATYDKLGRSFHEKLAQQNLVFSRDLGSSERRVAMGEYAIRIPQHFTTFLSLKGLPVKFIAPTEGLTYIQFDSAILKDAPHPNAALLLINFYLELDSQTVIANSGLAPTVKGAFEKSNLPAQGLLGFKLLGTSKSGQLDAMVARAKEIYK
ncbi:MAG: extracellular solute-binding protein [Methylobacteriaceae bacterium]|nr:extracellular solute-binding protein [Methylobacteriaceae bacterium]